MNEIRKTDISESTLPGKLQTGLRRIRFEILGGVDLIGERSSGYVERALERGELLRLQAEGSESGGKDQNKKQNKKNESGESDGADDAMNRSGSFLGNVVYTVGRLDCMRTGLPDLIKDDVDELLRSVKKRLDERDEGNQSASGGDSGAEEDAQAENDKSKPGLITRQLTVAIAVKDELITRVDEFSRDADLKGRELDHVIRRRGKERISGVQKAVGGFYNLLGLASRKDMRKMNRNLFKLSEAMRKEGEKGGEVVGLNRRESSRRTDSVSVEYDRRLKERRHVTV